MTKCVPAPKKSRASENVCFRCIRKDSSREKYDFVDECVYDVMLKMDNEELQLLSEEVLQAVLAVDTYETDWGELTLLGDCLARVYLHVLTRGGYLNGMFQKYENVEEVIRVAADRSMPANCVVSMFDEQQPFPECWLEMHRS